MMKNALLLSFFLSLGGCGAEPTDDLTGEVEEFATLAPKADGLSAPVGTYRGKDAVSLLVLKTDKSFRLEMPCPANARCSTPTLAYDGRFRLTRSGSGARYLILSASDSEWRFAYENDAVKQAVNLRQVYTTAWSKVARASAWCSAPGDCGLQSLATPACVGQHTCAASACSFTCGK